MGAKVRENGLDKRGKRKGGNVLMPDLA